MNRRSESARLVQMAAKLYDMRDRAKSLVGSRYEKHMRECRDVIESGQRRCGLSTLVAATKICEGLGEDGRIQSTLVMAAAVEMIEPSDGQQERSHA
jgi:hypothetical protein